MRIMKSKRGSAQIGAVFLMLTVMLFIGFWMAVFPIVIAKMQLDNYCQEVVRAVEITGEIDSSVNVRQHELEQRIVPTEVSFDGTNFMFGSTSKIQLNERIVVTAIYDYPFDYFVFHWNIRLQAKADGSSQVYWKE